MHWATVEMESFMSQWDAHHKVWPNRRKGTNMLFDRIRNALVAWLRGDIGHAWLGEGLGIEDACLDGEVIVVTFKPTSPGEMPFQATFTLTSVAHLTGPSANEPASTVQESLWAQH